MKDNYYCVFGWDCCNKVGIGARKVKYSDDVKDNAGIGECNGVSMMTMAMAMLYE